MDYQLNGQLACVFAGAHGIGAAFGDSGEERLRGERPIDARLRAETESGDAAHSSRLRERCYVAGLANEIDRLVLRLVKRARDHFRE